MPTLNILATRPRPNARDGAVGGQAGKPTGSQGSFSSAGAVPVGSISAHVLLHPRSFYARDDGQRAVEHAVIDQPDPSVSTHGPDVQEIHRFVEVERDNYFAFIFSVSDPAVITADGLKFVIFLDDHYVDYAYMATTDCMDLRAIDKANGVPAWQTGVARCGRRNSKLKWFEMEFSFRPINLVNVIHDVGLATRARRRASGMGSLRVEVHRLMRTTKKLDTKQLISSTVAYDDDFLAKSIAIQQDFLSDRSTTLCATLVGRSETRQIDVGGYFRQADGPSNPIAIFHWKYRTREALRGLGFHPPAGMPPPLPAPPMLPSPPQVKEKRLVDRAPETLTDKEKVQLIEELKTAVDTSRQASKARNTQAQQAYARRNMGSHGKRKRAVSPLPGHTSLPSKPPPQMQQSRPGAQIPLRPGRGGNIKIASTRSLLHDDTMPAGKKLKIEPSSARDA